MIYRIRENNHYCDWWWIPTITSKLELSGTFEILGDYEYVVDDQIATNKIFGFCDTLINHHKHSIRIGYRYYKNKCEVMCTYYNNGERKITKIGEYTKGEKAPFSIKIDGEFYVIVYKGKRTFLKRLSKYNMKYRLVLKPYFGGNSKAPHEIKIKIELN